MAYMGSLVAPPDTAIVWNWNLGNGQTYNGQNVPGVYYKDSGVYHITLQATNSLGCKGDTSKDITVFPIPTIDVTGDTTMMVGTGINIPVSFSANSVAYNWTPATGLSCTNCGIPYATPKFTTKYTVKVTDTNGCENTKTVTLVVLCNDKNFFIPNTFSPNNDGNNDRFYPRGTGINMIRALRIFNRWGEMVFEKRNFAANDASSGWDGTYNGKPASSDTYVYMIDIVCDNASIITYKGNITLIR
jgi:gliding motility-associated-like protein